MFAEQAALSGGEHFPLKHVLARHKTLKQKWWRRKAANDRRETEWKIVRNWHMFNFFKEEKVAKSTVFEAEKTTTAAAPEADAAVADASRGPKKEEDSPLLAAAKARCQALKLLRE